MVKYKADNNVQKMRMAYLLGEKGANDMRTITYTYDETKPTNRDYLIAALADRIDDGGASYESVAEYNINCPYYGYDDCLNEHEDPDRDSDSTEYKEACVRCKLSWLAMEHGQEVRLEDSNIDHDYKTMGALTNNQTKEQTLTLLTMILTPVRDEDQEESDEE